MPGLPDWPRAFGTPLFTGALKSVPADFLVTENLGFEPDGDGEHDLLWIEKTGTNTDWLARQLARHADIPARDVGYCGLKDRQAVTRQWFSVRRPGRDGTDWDALQIDGVSLVSLHRHRRKLRTGSHRSNTFEILLRSDGPPPADALAARVEALAELGAPNYFGAQRFGHDAGNLELARSVFDGRRRIDRKKRGLALSAARSFLFNEILARRISDRSWDQLLPGELAELAGSASVFDVDAVDETLRQRCIEMDIHPTASLWGRGAPRSGGRVATLERAVVDQHGALRDGLVKAGVDAGQRRLRLCVQGLQASVESAGVRLRFELGRGEYATSLLREIAEV
ncbi:MAG: tRNA pseudouridine(13) synthase TruD [Pseudomonadota bacterium]